MSARVRPLSAKVMSAASGSEGTEVSVRAETISAEASRLWGARWVGMVPAQSARET